MIPTTFGQGKEQPTTMLFTKEQIKGMLQNSMKGIIVKDVTIDENGIHATIDMDRDKLVQPILNSIDPAIRPYTSMEFRPDGILFTVDTARIISERLKSVGTMK
jgi:hypothetical protein